MSEPVDLVAIDAKTKRAFAKLRLELRPGLDAVLSNADGLARLLSITDEEWQAAVDADAGGNGE
jgi:hypothetical protein